MGTTLEYDLMVQKMLDEGTCVSRSEARRRVTLGAERAKEPAGNISSVKMSEQETAKEIEDITEGVFIEPVPIIEPTAAELDVIAATVLAPKKRGRPKGSRNKPKS